MQREDIRLLDRVGHDLALPRHGRQGADPVTQPGGAFELQIVGRSLHLVRHPLEHKAALALEEQRGFGDQGVVIGNGDQAGAGRAAAFDLMQHTGPTACVIDAVTAGAQQEGFLQCVERRVDRTSAGERTEVVAFDGMGAAVLGNLRCRMIAADDDFGK